MRSLRAPSPTSVAVLGFFYSSQTPHRHNSSSLLTDVGGHSSQTFTDLRAVCEESARTFTDVGGRFRLFFTPHRLLHRPNSSPLLTDVGAHSSPTFTDLHHPSQTSVRILTALIYNFVPIIQFLTDLIPHCCSLTCFDDIITVSIPHRPTPPFTDLHRHCSLPFHSVRIRCAYSTPLYSLRMRTAIAHRPSPTFTDLH